MQHMKKNNTLGPKGMNPGRNHIPAKPGLDFLDGDSYHVTIAVYACQLRSTSC